MGNSYGQIFMLQLLAGAVLMLLAWLWARKLNFYSLVDPVWSFGMGALAALACALAPGAPFRRGFLCAMALVWSGRLGLHLTRRLQAEFPHEDSRYQQLKKYWGAQAPRRFFLFYQFQALSQPVLLLPFLLGMHDRSPSLHWAELGGTLLFAFAWIGEVQSDRQLKLFKADPKHRGLVCEIGWWRLSRHPNYFFEWLIWCGFALSVVQAPAGALAFLAPALMFYLLNYVTGVPPAEQRSEASRGALYAEYQRRVSRFFLWWPKP